MAAVKSFPYFTSVLLYFSCLSGSLIPALLITDQADTRGVRDVAPFNYHSCTDTIKPSLLCSCNFVAINDLFSFFSSQTDQSEKIRVKSTARKTKYSGKK
jgi:hypothetical protein